MFDYTFVGAGPATISALEALISGGIIGNTLVLEAGSGSARKICPGLKASRCTSCFGDFCHVTDGIGGSSATFGNKLCSFPASSGVRRLAGRENGENSPEFKVRQNDGPWSSVAPLPGLLNRKVYNSDTLHFDEYRRSIENRVSEISRFAEIRSNAAVQTISQCSRNYHEITLENGQTIHSRNVIIATGRSGHQFSRSSFKTLGVVYQEQSADVGLRLECESDFIGPHFLYQRDPKFKFSLPGKGGARTFCTCIGGQIIPVKFGKGFYADGAFLKKDTRRTNFALMARTNENVRVDELEDWCSSVNYSAGWSLSLGTADLSTMSSSQLMDFVLESVGAWPTKTHRDLIYLLLKEIVGGDYIELFKECYSGDQRVRLFGPSVDRYWPAPSLGRGFSTNVDGVWVIGDAAGLSRGILQAEASGRGWAAHQSLLRAVPAVANSRRS